MTEHTILFLTMAGAALTALATLGLAIFAILAWKAASKNLELMEKSNEATNLAVKATIDSAEANTAVIIQGRQITALSDYSSALMDILGNLDVAGYPMKDQIQKTIILGINWAIHHPEETGQTAVVIDYQTDLSTVLRANWRHQSAQNPVNWSDTNAQDYLQTLLAYLFAWQISPQRRKELTEELKAGMAGLRHDVEVANAVQAVKENR